MQSERQRLEGDGNLTSAGMNMASESDVDRLQLQMHRIRRRVDSDVGELLTEAEQLFSWKYYVVRNPVACSVGAALLGFMLVPAKKHQVVSRVYLDPEVSQKIADQTAGVPIESEQPSEVKSGLILSLGALALNTLVKSGVSYASHFVKETILKEVAGRDLPQEVPNRNTRT
ncbi:hypothetical protein [Planctomicrobium sp. SH527]|uniref:hypothetical protein n=1 Tax=Planctomicrobium sp. SH527 TaxID=3448123 RepID=UPI003F5B50D1